MKNTVHQTQSHILNLIVLIVKQAIFRFKCLNKALTYYETKNLICEVNTIERFNTTKKGKCDHRWEPVQGIVQLYKT